MTQGILAVGHAGEHAVEQEATHGSEGRTRHRQAVPQGVHNERGQIPEFCIDVLDRSGKTYMPSSVGHLAAAVSPTNRLRRSHQYPWWRTRPSRAFAAVLRR